MEINPARHCCSDRFSNYIQPLSLYSTGRLLSAAIVRLTTGPSAVSAASDCPYFDA